MGIINNKNSLSQTIHDKVVEPTSKLRLHVDDGLAVLSSSSSRQYGNQQENENLWEKIEDAIGAAVNFFTGGGLAGNEIYLDIYTRTPNGIHKFVNVRLTADMLSGDSYSDIKKHVIDQQRALAVKIAYDGGRVTQVSLVNFVKLESTAAQALAAFAVDSNGNITGADATDAVNTALAGSSLGPSSSNVSNSVKIDGHSVLKKYETLIQQASSSFGIDPAFTAAVIMSESSGNPGAVSPTGARGLMQQEPGTYTELYNEIGSQYNLNNDPFDPKTNIFCGAKYASTLFQSFGKYELVAAAYNAGPGAVQKYGNTIPPYKETQNYVKRVMSLMGAYQQQTTLNTGHPLNDRPEIKKQDNTTATAHSGFATIGGAMS